MASVIVRYIARKYNLYGKTSMDQIHCDIIDEGIKDMLKKIVGYPYQIDKESWRAHRGGSREGSRDPPSRNISKKPKE